MEGQAEYKRNESLSLSWCQRRGLDVASVAGIVGCEAIGITLVTPSAASTVLGALGINITAGSAAALAIPVVGWVLIGIGVAGAIGYGCYKGYRWYKLKKSREQAASLSGSGANQAQAAATQTTTPNLTPTPTPAPSAFSTPSISSRAHARAASVHPPPLSTPSTVPSSAPSSLAPAYSTSNPSEFHTVHVLTPSPDLHSDVATLIENLLSEPAPLELSLDDQKELDFISSESREELERFILLYMDDDPISKKHVSKMSKEELVIWKFAKVTPEAFSRLPDSLRLRLSIAEEKVFEGRQEVANERLAASKELTRRLKQKTEDGAP